MKRLLCTLLILAMALSFGACDKGNQDSGKITVYIPDKVTIYDQTGEVYAAITYVFEEDWQTKESFTVTMSGDTDKMGGSGTAVYSDKKVVQEVSNGATAEMYYDANGNQIKMINRYASGGRREVTYTYDAKGRVITEEEKMYETADSEPVTTTQTYSYTDTETGSSSTQTDDYATYITEYDKNGRMVSQSMVMNEQEVNRTEVTYDEAGNMTSQVSYYNGQKQMEVKYTWKAVEVSTETAARLPQFKKGN